MQLKKKATNGTMTAQGVKNLNHGRTIRKNDTPSNCALGIHAWDQWKNGYPMADYRQCLECPEVEYYTASDNERAA